MRWPANLGALLLVARKTHLRLGTLVANLVVRDVNLMARCAGNITALVGAASPMRTLRVLRVAGQTSAALRNRFRLTLTAEQYVRLRSILDAFGLVDVFVALAVATHARWRAAIGPGAVTRLANRQYRVRVTFVVAFCAPRVAVENDVFA